MSPGFFLWLSLIAFASFQPSTCKSCPTVNEGILNGQFSQYHIDTVSATGEPKPVSTTLDSPPAFSAPVTPEADRDPGKLGYTRLPWVGWYKFYLGYRLELNWTAARDTCRREGADFVIPDSREKMKKIEENVSRGQPFWLGVYDPGHNNTWITLNCDGVPTQWWAPRDVKEKNDHCGSWDNGLLSTPCTVPGPFLCELH